MALEAAERRMSELLEDLQLMVVIVRPNGEISFCNHHLYQFTGWQPSDVIGENWVDLMIPDGDRDKVRAAIATDKHRRCGCPFILRVRCSGRKEIAVGSPGTASACVIPRGKSPRRRTSGRDITDFKKLEGQFQQAQKLESIGRLAGGVAARFQQSADGNQGS